MFLENQVGLNDQSDLNPLIIFNLNFQEVDFVILKIYGPILPVITVDSSDEALEYVNNL